MNASKFFKTAACFALTAGLLTGCGQKADNPAKTDAPSGGTTASEGKGDLADKKIGVCIYKFDDNFMTMFRNELQSYLESLGFSKDNIMIVDGNNDQATQTNQIDTFISQGVDLMIVNPVNASSTSTITDKVVGADIPLVYINREPDKDEEARWAENDWDVTYVGCDASQSGTFQGEMIAELGLDKIDRNGNGKVDYVMIEGDPENVDAELRTKYSVKALEDAGFKVNCLDDQLGNWDQSLAQQLVANSLAKDGDNVEVVFCNNDAMAMGALQSIKTAGRKPGEDIFLVGVDALAEALEAIQKGEMTGTVFNDHITQSHSAADAAVNYLEGKGNEHYIGCDYVKVATPDKASEILELVKKK